MRDTPKSSAIWVWVSPLNSFRNICGSLLFLLEFVRFCKFIFVLECGVVVFILIGILCGGGRCWGLVNVIYYLGLGTLDLRWVEG